MTTNKQQADEEATYAAPGEAAKLLFVTTKTLQRMAERGEIESIRLPSGHRRYMRAGIDAIRNGRTA